jgi:hypothetical protein
MAYCLINYGHGYLYLTERLCEACDNILDDNAIPFTSMLILLYVVLLHKLIS